MTNKTMFAIFLVIFVMLIFVMMLRSRAQNQQQQEHFNYYALTNNLLMAFISNPNCVSVGNILSSNTYSTIQGVFEAEKLETYDQTNQDLWCVENYNFLYSIVVEDKSHNQWHLGLLNTNPRWADRKVTVSLPIVVRFENGVAHSAVVSMNSYIGSIPGLYGAIKQVCVANKGASYRVSTNYLIQYDSENNVFKIGNDYFYPYFSCHVNDFEIPKGRHLVYIDYGGKGADVRI